MRKSVIVTPSIVMMVASVRRNQFFHELFEVFNESWLVFDGGEGSSRACDEKSNQAVVDLGVSDLRCHFAGNIDDVAKTLCGLNEL
jgi:hypothetical protein